MSPLRTLATAGAISCCSIFSNMAADATAPAPSPGAPAANAPAASAAPVLEAAPAKLPYGVEDVVKLSRAQVNEEVIVNYIQGSGTIYNLAPKDIVYMRNEGVSDRVINSMLDQRKAAIAQTAQPAPAPDASAAPPEAGAPAAPPAYAPVYVQPPPVETQPAPSTVYVIPYGARGYAGPTYYSYVSPFYYGGWYGGYRSGPYCYYGSRVYIGGRYGGYGHYHGGHHRR